MQTVFEAANSIEARLLLGILNQAGINGHIDGEYLQGGVGELQAFGLVRLKVAAADFAEAKAIVGDWQAGEMQADEIQGSAGPFEKSQSGALEDPSAAAPKTASRGAIVGLLIGLIIAGLVVIGTILSPLQ